MARPELDLVVPEKCSHCKLKETGRCEGHGLIKGALLIVCPAFIDKRSSQIINESIEVPFPVITKKRKRGGR